MNIVRELRKKAGITQEELAQIVGVVQPTVSDWENARKDPSDIRLKKLAEYFGVEESVILGRAMVCLPGSQGLYSAASEKEEQEINRTKPNYENAAMKAIETLIRYHVCAVPVSPLHLLQTMPGVLVVTFTEMADRAGLDRKNLAASFGSESQDALTFASTANERRRFIVAYNQRMPTDIIQRALGREMGHIILAHDPAGRIPAQRDEALCFSRHLLFPRPLIRAIQDAGIRISVKLLGNITGSYGRTIAGMRNTPGVIVPGELNRICRAQFDPYLQDLIAMQDIMENEDDSAWADFGTYMDGYEE